MRENNPPKQKRSLRDIRRNLRVIYTGTDGVIPDMTKLTSHKRSALRRFLLKSIIFLFILSAVAWTGFFLFSNGLFNKKDSLSIKINGPTEVKAGQEVSFAINYENTGTVPLAALELSVNLPSTFHITTAIPEATEKNVWTIGSLTPKSDGVITINGIFLSEIPSAERLQTLFTYKPANFNSSFQQIEVHKINLNDSVLNLTINGPEKVLPGDEVEYVITTGQMEKNPMFNLRITPVLPQDFTISNANPEFAAGQSYWNLSTLNSNEPKTFSIKGTYTSSANGEQTFGTHIGFMDQDNYLKQKEVQSKTEMLGGSIGFHLIVNGSNTDQTIDAGKTIRGSIDYANQGTDTAKDVSFVLSLDADGKTIPIDWDKAEISGGKRNENSITWNKSSLNSLSFLKPKDAGVIDFTLPALVNASVDHFTIKLTTAIGSVGDTNSARTIDSTPIIISINSNVTLKTESRYFTEEGQPVGSGPLPPKVGQTTTYRVYWNISNSLHDLSTIKISATLPSGITWIEKKLTDIGDITFNSTTKTVTWNVAKLPSSIQKAGAWFDVSINPTSKDIGKFITLTNATSFTAKDLITKQDLANSVSNVTTELPNDAFANGKGTVTK